MKDFLKGSLRTAVSIFAALLALTIVVGGYSAAKDLYAKQQLKPLEQLRYWKSDLKSSLGFEATARTKLVGGNVLVSVDVSGYPKYFSNPKNERAYLFFEFLDQDGFKVISKPLQLAEFTTIVDEQGRKSGLSQQFKEYVDVERYKQVSRMQVLWNLD